MAPSSKNGIERGAPDKDPENGEPSIEDADFQDLREALSDVLSPNFSWPDPELVALECDEVPRLHGAQASCTPERLETPDNMSSNTPSTSSANMRPDPQICKIHPHASAQRIAIPAECDSLTGPQSHQVLAGSPDANIEQSDEEKANLRQSSRRIGAHNSCFHSASQSLVLSTSVRKPGIVEQTNKLLDQDILWVPDAFQQRLHALTQLDAGMTFMPQVGHKAHMEKVAMSRMIREIDRTLLPKETSEKKTDSSLVSSNKRTQKEELVEDKAGHEGVNGRTGASTVSNIEGRGRSRPPQNRRRKITSRAYGDTPSDGQLIKPNTLEANASSGSEYLHRDELRRRRKREHARKTWLRQGAYLKSLELAVQDGDLFRQIVCNAEDMISVHNLDPGGTYRYISPSFEKKTGYTLADLKMVSAYELYEEDDHEHIMLGHQSLLVDMDCSRAIFRLKLKDGRRIWVESSAVAAQDCLIGITRDISGTTKLR